MNNVNDDLLDEGLQAIMGKDRFQNEWWSGNNPGSVNGTPVKEKCDPMEAHLEYEEENWLDKLKTMVKGIACPAVLCLFFFWCQQTGRMADETAVAAMFVCVGVACYRVGRAAK